MMAKDDGLRAGGAACAAIWVACHLSVALPASAAPVVGAGPEWHNVNGDSDETGYSRLDKITPANAGKLGLAWYLNLPGEVTSRSRADRSRRPVVLHRLVRAGVCVGGRRRQAGLEHSIRDLAAQSR